MSIHTNVGFRQIQRRRRGSAGFTPFDQGFNFRGTSGFVADGANETYVLSGDQYPTTRLFASPFGWNANASTGGQNHDNTVDRRLAGIGYDAADAANFFRVDGLVAGGVYKIHLALGSPSSGENIGVTVKDGSTVLFTIANGSTLAGHSVDATGTDSLTAAWPGSEVGVSVTMAGTSLTVFINVVSHPIQHLRIVRTA
jgi:hypothetical protein